MVATIPASLTGRSYVVTGSTDGIGKTTAAELLKRGATVVVHGRTKAKVEAVAASMPGPGKAIPLAANLSSLAQAASFADAAAAAIPGGADVLINNAGIYAAERTLSTDGIELNFAVNVLATVLLTRRFVRSGGLKKGGRIVNVSSMMHAQASGVYALDNLQLEKTGYDPHTAYSLSKLCLTMWSIELAAELKGVADVISCHPGVVQTKMLTKGFGNFGSDVNAAHHELLLATAPELKGVTGKYFMPDAQESRTAPPTNNAHARSALMEKVDAMIAPFDTECTS